MPLLLPLAFEEHELHLVAMLVHNLSAVGSEIVGAWVSVRRGKLLPANIIRVSSFDGPSHTDSPAPAVDIVLHTHTLQDAHHSHDMRPSTHTCTVPNPTHYTPHPTSHPSLDDKENPFQIRFNPKGNSFRFQSDSPS